jgi:hypothetical protein
MRNKNLCLLIINLLLPFSSIFAQAQAGSIPSWFFQAENYNRINRAVGISDPNPDTTLALEQAKINAMINYSLLHDGTFSSLTNVGMGSQQDNNVPTSNLEYILYTSIIKGKLPSDSSVKIKEKFFTNYHEAIVLIEIDYKPSMGTILPEYTITRSTGFHHENNSLPFFIDELNIQVSHHDSIILETEISKDGAKFNDLRKAGEKHFLNDNSGPKTPFFYAESTSGSSPSKWPFMPCPMNSGLWKAYIFNLIDQLSLYNSMDINCQYKLSTSNIGTISKPDQSFTFQQLVYSLKNVQSVKLNNSIAGIYTSGNNLQLSIKSGKQPGTSNPGIIPNKSEKKLLKKMLADNWKYLGEDDFETSWQKAMYGCRQNDTYINAEIEIQANSLQSGILEGIQLAKLHISSQLATKVNAQAKTDLQNSNELAIKSAKLINVQKTGCIAPYFIFYQNLAQNVYKLKIIVLYDLKQVEGF